MARMQGNTVDYSNYFFIDWSLNSQNVAGNYSNISWWAYWHFQNNDRQLDNGYANLGDVNRWSNGGRIYNYAGNFTTRDLLLASGSFDLGHNNDGTKTLNVAGGATGYSGERSEGSGSWALPTIPRNATMTAHQGDFNDEQNPWVSFSNPGGFQVNVRLEFNGQTVAQRNNVGSTYYWTLTDTERNTLRSLCADANSKSIRTVVATVRDGSEQAWDWRDNTFSIVNAAPVFTNSQVTYQDTNSTVVAITTDNQKIVQNQSTLRAAFTAATGQKYATITSYKVTLGTDVRTFTTAQTAINYAALNISVDTPITVEATDTRGNKTTATKTVTFLPWSNPRAVLTIGRVNNYEDTTNLKADVTIDSVNSKNAILSIQLRYKKTSDSTWTTTTMTTGVQKTITIDKLYEWNIEITITDKFGSTVYTSLVSKGIPIMFIDNSMLNIGINKFPVAGRILDISGAVYIDNLKAAQLNANNNLPAEQLENPYKFAAYVASNASCNDKVTTDIIGYTKQFDTHSDFNATTGVFTVPITGYYFVAASVRIGTNNAGSGESRWLWDASATLRDATNNVDLDQAKHYVYADGRLTLFDGKIGRIHYLTAETTLKLQAFADTNDGSSWYVNGGVECTHFSAFLVSKA